MVMASIIIIRNMMIILLLLVYSAVFQANGQNETEYCEELERYHVSDLVDCDELCTECFSTAHNQCFECSSILRGVAVNVEEKCQGFVVTEERKVLDCSERNNILIIIIAASAGGGAALLCCLLVTCICCCCCIKRKRKKKSFDMHSGDHGAEAPIIQGEVTAYALKNTNLNQDLSPNMNEVFPAGDTTRSSPPRPLVASSRATPPAQAQAIKKSASSYETTGSNGDVPSSLLQDKGYVKMSSVGPLRYQSLQNLVSADENDIYVEADRPQGSSEAVSTLPHTLRAPPSTSPRPPVLHSSDAPKPSKHHKPATLPKPKALQVNPQLPKAPILKRSEQSDGGESSEQDDDDYESPEVFREDKDKQNVENYYNKDALIVPGKALKPPPAPPSSSSNTEPQQIIYANVDPNCEDHSSASSDERHSSYESLRNYLSDTGRKEKRDSTKYYNLPETANREGSPEDEMYVYMKSGQNILTEATSTTPSLLPSKDRKRLESEPVSKGKKYMNFTREQQLHKASKLKEKSADSAETRHENGMSEDEMPLYANLDETENEELYTEVT